ncbi:UDP-N-acetylmuramoyl-L-alanine--D-glutamate ligase [Adhaeribacter aquaticus]|uniref:UDP-N-acetylmuramoyl-L-alanine--D-glutamate ligase n=1 Tax=Adhaeribacter aquaticus TaxID=299567 RepID=UPI0003F72864|nr:UDP-N-acetylmuramoyl-L-alanine--D-glutamate ligase [Adhaeribacter aquaticus]
MIAILGAGESGVGAALLAKAKGLEVFVSDMSSIREAYKETLEQNHIPFEEGKHDYDKILSANEIIKSPGIPDKAEIIKQAKAKNIPIISEIEFAGRYTQAKFICITGTNGKTTTTLLTYHLLKSAGLNVALAGNIGESLAQKVITDTTDYYVVELSSFQLDNMYQFKAHISILLNITPDHLDRYDYCMDNYAKSKLRITQNMTPSDYFIYNSEDEVIKKHFSQEDFTGTAVPFGLNQQHGIRAYFQEEVIVTEIAGIRDIVNVSTSPLIGKHNQYNTLAAVTAALLMGIKPPQIEKALATFQNADHRLQPVGTSAGVTYINDSKATNVEAVWYALEGIKKPIIWIAGGVDKGNNYETLVPLAKEKIKALICLGKENAKLLQAFKDVIPIIEETQSVDEAVQKAKAGAVAGDVVLLSPACASFDLFQNYEHRGRSFAEAVQRLVLNPS